MDSSTTSDTRIFSFALVSFLELTGNTGSSKTRYQYKYRFNETDRANIRVSTGLPMGFKFRKH